ncbi:nucleotidyltransferase domain-containing protein [Actinoalloteichus spitiensis]|uniref:nucleotidyltransferase domain-containing protein n=1 Tax=Actinoalloteichus spitiensis TaxID=252394 RepID=UPI00035C9D9B|nr:nucleotidyltransferase domain-containing protein [Actinoalloteichus spitiensis]
MDEHGLDGAGTISREGALDRVGAEFAPVVEATRARLVAAFDAARVHGAYLYGSIPRGTAVPGRSDLDVLVVLRGEPTDTDRARVRSIESALDEAFPQIDGAGILLSSAASLLSDGERYDGGFFVACLCTPLLGEDLAERLPRYRPDSVLARETNGNLGSLLPRWRERHAAATTDAERRSLVRGVARRVVRTGFTLVMPRWGGWTSDLTRSADLFARYYPDRGERMRAAAEAALAPTADGDVLGMLLDDLGPWLAEEYAAVHGVPGPR